MKKISKKWSQFLKILNFFKKKKNIFVIKLLEAFRDIAIIILG